MSATAAPPVADEREPDDGPRGGRRSAPLWNAVCAHVPALDALRGYSTRIFAQDLSAGLTVAAVAVPQAMAYAQIAGIPPQYGLYTAIVMTAVGALFDSSKQLINGPTNAISIATLSALVAFSDADRLPAAILLALLVGAVQLGITLLRLGDLTKYISHAVIVGFTVGASVLLVLDQLKNLCGLPARGAADDHFLKRFWLTMSHAADGNQQALAIGLGSIVLALGLRGLGRLCRIRVPDLLLTVIAMAALVWWLNPAGLALVGEIPRNLPSFELPQLRWDWVHQLAGSSLAIAVLGLLEAVSMAKAIAAQTRQKLDINQQCLSEAVANTTGSLFQCMPGSGSLTRSAINQQAGGRTQWSGVFSAAAVALTMVLFAPYARFIPKAALAGILMLSAARMVQWRELGRYLRVTRFDATIVCLTAISAVAVSIEFCVLIGVLLSFVLYVPKAARVHMTELTLAGDRVVRERVSTDERCNRLRIFSLEGELFFGAAPELEEHLEEIAATAAEGVRVVVLRLKRIRNPDTVCLDVLGRFIDHSKELGLTVVFCAVRPDLMRALTAAGLVRRLGQERMFVFTETGAVWTSTLEAIRFAYQVLGDNRCDHCPRRDLDLSAKDGWHYVI